MKQFLVLAAVVALSMAADSKDMNSEDQSTEASRYVGYSPGGLEGDYGFGPGYARGRYGNYGPGFGRGGYGAGYPGAYPGYDRPYGAYGAFGAYNRGTLYGYGSGFGRSGRAYGGYGPRAYLNAGYGRAGLYQRGRLTGGYNGGYY